MEEDGLNSLPSGLVNFDNQVAGHSSKDGKTPSGLLKHVDGFVFKPLTKFPAGDNEVNFYEALKTSADLSVLRKFVPEYYGTVVIQIHGKDIKFLKLEDVTTSIVKPCIMDVKIGEQTWEPTASEEKREAEIKKYTATKEAFGFCIPGYQVYEIASRKFIKRSKVEGKLLTKDTLPLALQEFFNYKTRNSKFLIDCYLQQLVQLLSWWQKQTVYHFYSSSLLFIYDSSKLEEEIRCQDTVNIHSIPWIKLYCIDFAHVVHANNNLDLNYINGLNNLIHLLESLKIC